MLEKWNSLGNHLQNVHEGHEEIYPVCSNGKLERRNRKKKQVRIHVEFIAYWNWKNNKIVFELYLPFHLLMHNGK
jgi:hypothetical protein